MRLLPFASLDRRPATWPGASRIGWLSETFFAHRGLHGAGTMENSRAAWAAAMARGFGVECDVQLTADDEAVVFHDFTLERLTRHHGAVVDRTASALAKIPLGDGGETIPSLQTLLDTIAGRVPLLIEIKSRRKLPVSRLCWAVQRVLLGYGGPHAVMSFDPRAPAWFARHAPHTPRGLVITEEGRKRIHHTLLRHLALRQARPDFLAYDIRDLPSPFAAAQRRRGLPIAAWTVRTPALLARADVHADAPIAEGTAIAPGRR